MDVQAILVNRFWSKVIIRSPDECWEWTGAHDPNGYGRFSMARTWTTLAHRTAYEFAKGPLPAGADALHSCDNPPCCNPNHLWAGTALDNVRDCIEKNRFNTRILPGSRNGRAKLTDENILDIRREAASGETRASLARRFGISPGLTSQICLGRIWKHLL